MALERSVSPVDVAAATAARLPEHSGRVQQAKVTGVDSGRRDYRVEYAVYPGNLQKDILNAAAEGYHALVIGAAGRFCAVLEREPADSCEHEPPEPR